MQVATLGAGCFWCVEAVFQKFKGVETVVSGFTNGRVKNPSYKEICSGLTEHAEVCRIEFDPEIISFEELLTVFFHAHDPTTLNRQGNDAGTQYRSGIFFHSEEQETIAKAVFAKIDASDLWPDPIVTEITKADIFYPAEDYHQNYFNMHQSEGYCSIVIAPKVSKISKLFSEKLKI